MPGKYPYDTILTAVELRWIKNSYHRMIDSNPHAGMGSAKLVKKINEGRIKAKQKPISRQTVERAIKKIELGVPIRPYDGTAKKGIICPECGHAFDIKK